MSIILGIDPGSQTTGFGVIRAERNQYHFIAAGCIRLQKISALAERLKKIFLGIKQAIERYNPDQVSVERVFVGRNIDSALKLGHARGAAIVAAVQFDLPVAEYSPRQVKQTVVGYGGADKAQVQQMVRMLLKLNKPPAVDAADALAIAMCHAQMQNCQRIIEG